MKDQIDYLVEAHYENPNDEEKRIGIIEIEVYNSSIYVITISREDGKKVHIKLNGEFEVIEHIVGEPSNLEFIPFTSEENNKQEEIIKTLNNDSKMRIEMGGETIKDLINL